MDDDQIRVARMEGDLHDRTEEDVLDNMEYFLVVRYDGDIIAKTSAHSLEALEEENYKIERAVERKIEEVHEERMLSGYYDEDVDEQLKDIRGGHQ